MPPVLVFKRFVACERYVNAHNYNSDVSLWRQKVQPADCLSILSTHSNNTG